MFTVPFSPPAASAPRPTRAHEPKGRTVAGNPRYNRIMVRHLPILAIVLLSGVPARAYNTNTVWWAADQLPVRFQLVEPGSWDLGPERTEEVTIEALEAWTGVGCTSLTTEFLGWTDEVVLGDGIVQVEWVEEGWVGDEAIAAATAVQVDPEEGRITDVNIQFNGEYLDWVTEDSNPYLSPMALDSRAVLVHEFGHVFGMDHNGEMVEATMFYAYISATTGYLSWDDKWGICALYPADGDECEVDADCPEHPDQSYVCREIPEIGHRVCEEVYDDLGACCDAHWNNCVSALCHAYASAGYAGYCSSFCDDEEDCPPGWSCEALSYLGEARSWCVSPEGADQPCGEDFEWPADDDDSAADDDDSAGDDDQAVDDDDDGGDGCACSLPRGGTGCGPGALALALALVGMCVRRAGR